MGLVARGRRLFGFLLMGSIAIQASQAQNRPTSSSVQSHSNIPATILTTLNAGQEQSSQPSLSNSPSLSSIPSLGPSTSHQPSHVPSKVPSISTVPSISNVPSESPSLSYMPSESRRPSVTPSSLPTISQAPSEHSLPSEQPSQSQAPSINISPSFAPSTVPSISNVPSESAYPSVPPTSSMAPSTSSQPTKMVDKPIFQWTILVGNRFQRAFTSAETGDMILDSDTDSVNTTITVSNTTSIRMAGEASTNKPILALTGESTIVLNEWVDVSDYRKVQMLFWFNARRNQANVQTNRFEVNYANRTTNTTTAGDWILLKTFQRGSGRFRRNSRWYLGKVAIDTTDLEAIPFRFESFYPTTRQMVLLDKFAILGYTKDATTTSDTEKKDSTDSNQAMSPTQESQGVPNRSDAIQPIRGKYSNVFPHGG